MQIEIFSHDNAAAKAMLDVSETVFDQPFNEPLVHQVVTACLANQRQGTHQQKTRAEVRGGGIKPWRQKGTGRARAGTIRSPIWRHGGRAFAARPGVYNQKINKKMYAKAMCSILSQLLRDKRLLIVGKINISQPKTSLMIKYLKDLNLKKPLIVVDNIETNLALSVRNLVNVSLINLSTLSPIALLSHENILMTKDVLEKLNGEFKGE